MIIHEKKTYKLSAIIATKKESRTIIKALKRLEISLKKTHLPFEIIVISGDTKSFALIKKYIEQSKSKFILQQDRGTGKAKALNQALKLVKGDILIFSDGDVLIKNPNSIKYLVNSFEGKVGLVSARPISINKKKHKFDYWADYLTKMAHIERKKHSKSHRLYPASGYLYATLRKITPKLPGNILADDYYISSYIFSRGYQIQYQPAATVIFKAPANYGDFIKQKIRTFAGTKQTNDHFPRIIHNRTLLKEISHGIQNLRKLGRKYYRFWTLELYIVRLLVWFLANYYLLINKNNPLTLWKEIKSTKKLQ